ncbi:hypothetical protein D3C85_1130080 [compost metagenome]
MGSGYEFHQLATVQTIHDGEATCRSNWGHLVCCQVVNLVRGKRNAVHQPLVDQGLKAATNFQTIIRFSDVQSGHGRDDAGDPFALTSGDCFQDCVGDQLIALSRVHLGHWFNSGLVHCVFLGEFLIQ